jgi:RNA polymerase sigma-70 factor (sigma-E family)
MMPEMTERAVVDERDEQLAALHRAHYDALVRLACLLVDDAGSGEEVVQEAFVRVHGAWARIDDPLTYLRATVTNLARSRLRRRAVARRYVPPPALAAASAEEDAAVGAEHEFVFDAVRALPRRQRECVVLRYYLDLSEVEIAAALGISSGSVKSHTHRGMRTLAARLEER